MSNILIASSDVHHDFQKNEMFLPLVTKQKSRVCKWAEHLHAWCYMPHSNLIMQQDYFQKRKQINLLTPSRGSRVSVRAKHLLICYCKLHVLKFDMQHDHILKKLIL